MPPTAESVVVACCRMVSPAVEELSRSLAGKLKVVKVNVDQAPGTAGRLGVQGVPTLLLIKDGEETARQVGALPEPALRGWLTRNLPDAAGQGS